MGYSDHGSDPKITNIVFSDGVTEQSHIFNENVKKFDILAKNGKSFQFAYIENGTSSIFKTVPAKATYFEEFIKGSFTIYLLVPTATGGDTETIEILEWESAD